MASVTKIIKWKNQNITLDHISVSADEEVINKKVKMAIIDALNNKPNPILQIDWSKFGENNDCIEIEDVKIGGIL